MLVAARDHASRVERAGERARGVDSTRGGEPAFDAMSDEPCMKGVALRELLVWYAGSWEGGRERIRSAATSLPPELARYVHVDEPDLGLRRSAWYPAALCGAILDHVFRGIGPAEHARLVREGTRAGAEKMLRGVYKRLFAMLATPSRYARYVGRAWKQIHSTGERYMVLTGPGRAESAILDWGGHHPVLCEITTETMVVLFEHMGLANVQATQTSCVSRGSADCRALLTWEPQSGPRRVRA